MQQQSNEWFEARLGRVTASRIADVMAKTKNGWSASRENYMAQLVCEILTGKRIETFTSQAMQHGVETEPQARASYTMATFNAVEETGFVLHPSIEGAGASPDGLVGETGLVEIKCPNTATHIKTLRGAEIDGQYIKQMQFQMACTGREWCDFVSFDPRLPDEMQLWIQRVERDDEQVAEIEKAVREFLAGVYDAVADLRKKYPEAA